MIEIAELKKQVENYKVLFVDDEEHIRKSSGMLFKKFFNDVTICVDGEEGLKTFTSDPTYDIVVTDILMPKLNGIDMAREIKKIKPDVMVVFITASREEEVEDDLFVQYITKPISYDDVIAFLEMLIDKNG